MGLNYSSTNVFEPLVVKVNIMSQTPCVWMIRPISSSKLRPPRASPPPQSDHLNSRLTCHETIVRY